MIDKLGDAKTMAIFFVAVVVVALFSLKNLLGVGHWHFHLNVAGKL